MIKKEIFVGIIAVVFFYVCSTQAKSLYQQKHLVNTNATHSFATKLCAQVLEGRLTPFLENRIKVKLGLTSPPAYRNKQQTIQADLFALARLWNLMSPEFQSLYLGAIEIPPGMNMHLSAGYQIEVYYTTKGPNAVAPEDRYGYDSNNWRVKVDGPNGVPDFVDENAWALDSAWSMEIERFGFVQPIGYKDKNYNSSRYKVVLQNPGEGFYGMTYFSPQQKVTPAGFASRIDLRHSWDGWNANGFDYQTYPHKAIRVTAVHEFFHAIQYAMVHNVVDDVWLDDFPVSWVEGCAVLMEEIGFDEVNDYIQYNTYFLRPREPMLDRVYDGLTEYKNCMLTMYIYEHIGEKPGIGFIRRVFYNNYLKPIPFHENLQITSQFYGYNWVDILNKFHAASYFSGSRADTTKFINDAAILGSWSYFEDDFYLADTVEKQIKPYAMETFCLKTASHHGDTITVVLADPKGVSTQLWAATCILKKNADTTADSLVNIPFSHGRGAIVIENWQSYQKALIVVTNGNAQYSRLMKAFLLKNTAMPVQHIKNTHPYAYPNPIRLSQNATVYIAGISLLKVKIYSQNGMLIYTDENSVNNSTKGFTWTISNSSANEVMPGVYYAVVEYMPDDDFEKKIKKIKLLLIP